MYCKIDRYRFDNDRHGYSGAAPLTAQGACSSVDQTKRVSRTVVHGCVGVQRLRSNGRLSLGPLAFQSPSAVIVE